MKIVLLGATGLTGRLLLKQLLSRGIKPVLVGRNRDKLLSLSQQYGGLDVGIADAQDFTSLSNLLNKGDLLISTVGPFCELGEVPLRVAVEKGAHYMDSTGEPAFIASVYDQYEKRLENTSTVILTACGFDYVPGQLVGAKLAQELGAEVATLNISYAQPNGGIVRLSAGTKSSLVKGLFERGTFYNNKQWREDFLGEKTHSIVAGDNKIKVISVSGSECFELPRMYPTLDNVNVYLGWFGPLGGLVSCISRLQQKLLKIPGYLKMMQALAARVQFPAINVEKITAKDEGGSLVVAEAFDSNGKLIKQCTLSGHNMYYYTGEIMAWIVSKIQRGEIKACGVVGPVRAFGLEALEQAHIDIGFSVH
ncbi:saccharopine dehydrogenase NADP-binding domain-containing protein [Oceanicoccus sp. KOV_DT_Chl]|uniref:saccharopine dehydrogenase NADP-binding domain-containing protein n=1 Tax=Oceanicoccus sp. KOV_DT_Chl TaxID=1904639 RepID=UPI0013567BA1|nr:saccharopine dehydrogenase NADP-binding domain-containing protein [Oceanicoccus sp. KOV_DT_Chl]